MKLLNWLTCGLTALSLIACGGGGNTPVVPPTNGGGGTSTAATVELSTSAAQIGSGSGEATITAVVKDSRNVSIGSAPIVFSVDSGTLTNAGTTTGADGTATAKLSAGTNKANRTVTVTATSGAATATVKVAIVASQQTIELISDNGQIGSGGEEATITALVKDENNVSVANAPMTFSSTSGTLSGASTATNTAGVATVKLTAGADKSNRTVTVTATSGTSTKTIQVLIAGTQLQYVGASTLQLGKTATITATVVDSRKVGIAGVPVTVTSRLNNGLSAASVTTDSKGIATLTYTATNAGNDTITFTALGASLQQSMVVSGENFEFISPAQGSTFPVSTPTTVAVRYKVGNVGRAGQQIVFSSTGGTIAAQNGGITNADGDAFATIASDTANPVTVVARLAGGATAEATLQVRFIATVPNKLTLQITPTSLPPNPAGSTAQLASVIATVRDVAGNPVQGVFVNFTRDADPSGGNLSQGSIQTDAAGQAAVQYFAGATTTSNNAVVLRASVAGAPTVTGTATLTVNRSALFIALGTSNVISNPTPEEYQKDWVVYVTDSNGIAVPNVQITAKILPVQYMKGALYWNSRIWTHGPEGPNASPIPPYYVCQNEDLNYSGELDPGEDFNRSGRLDPGNVIPVSPNTVTTDSLGRATLSLRYAESYVPWVKVTLQVTAVVSGTESARSQTFEVEGLSTDFSNESVAPAGQTSPFGTGPCDQPN